MSPQTSDSLKQNGVLWGQRKSKGLQLSGFLWSICRFGDEITFFLLVFLKGVTLIKPVIFGNVSHYFGKKRETDGHTHGWTVFLRPFKNEVSGIFSHENEFFEKALD